MMGQAKSERHLGSLNQIDGGKTSRPFIPERIKVRQDGDTGLKNEKGVTARLP
jgi:hypothetical protein